MWRILNTFTGSRHALSHTSCYFGNIASIHSGRVQTRQLEVERKFLVTPAAVTYLRSNGGGSRFKRYESLGKQTTHDTYYDQNNVLFLRGVYIRRRNGHWEAKIRTGGDLINSAFTEIDGTNAVKEIIEQNLPITADGRNIEDILDPCADFVTERESWIIEGSYKVDVDTTDFGHIVGEVELTRILQDADEEEEAGLTEKMDQDIKAFMQSCPQAFPTGRPVGKLSAYFDQMSHRL